MKRIKNFDESTIVVWCRSIILCQFSNLVVRWCLLRQVEYISSKNDCVMKSTVIDVNKTHLKKLCHSCLDKVICKILNLSDLMLKDCLKSKTEDCQQRDHLLKNLRKWLIYRLSIYYFNSAKTCFFHFRNNITT